MMNRSPLPRRVACLLVLAFSGCGRPPQIGEDRAAFKAVDALYTAVSLRDPKLLDQCEGELRSLQAKGGLSEAAGGVLGTIITKAKEGEWETSQSRLGDFMRGQRR
ncbi:hypothetical protein V5E97_01480 [Singulisphaera sp. Ch08]|uniref:Uncharacterized protein n=1 Tax=Singulisphaera sp. Ch08 TaxID=3120278 RepID=A0AAU7CI21_9BACT